MLSNEEYVKGMMEKWDPFPGLSGPPGPLNTWNPGSPRTHGIPGTLVIEINPSEYRTQSKIYDGAFLRKQLMVCSCLLFLQKSSIVDVRLDSFKKNFMAPFYGWGSTVSRLQSHYEETVYLLPLSSQKFLVMI